MKASADAADRAAQASLPSPPSPSLAQLQGSIETVSAAELAGTDADKLLREIDESQNEETFQRITLPIPSEYGTGVVLLFGRFCDETEHRRILWSIGYEITLGSCGHRDVVEPNTDPSDISTAAYSTLAEAIQEACSAVQNRIIENGGGKASGKAFLVHRAIGEWAKEVDGEVNESIFDDPEAIAKTEKPRLGPPVYDDPEQTAAWIARDPNITDKKENPMSEENPMLDVSLPTLVAMAEDIRAALVPLEPIVKAIVKLQAIEKWIGQQLGKVQSAEEGKASVERRTTLTEAWAETIRSATEDSAFYQERRLLLARLTELRRRHDAGELGRHFKKPDLLWIESIVNGGVEFLTSNPAEVVALIKFLGKNETKTTDAAREAEGRGTDATEGRAPNPPANTPTGSKPEGKQDTAAGASAISQTEGYFNIIVKDRAAADKASADTTLAACGGDTPPRLPPFSSLLDKIPGIPPVALKILVSNGITTIDDYRALPAAKHPSKGLLKDATGKNTFTEGRIKKTEAAIAEWMAKHGSATASTQAGHPRGLPVGGNADVSKLPVQSKDALPVADPVEIQSVAPIVPSPAQKPLEFPEDVFIL